MPVDRLPLVAALAVAVAAAATAQPPDLPPRNPYDVPDPVTAFPEIEPPDRDAQEWPDPARTFPLMFGSTPRAFPPGTPPVTRLRVARINQLAE